MRSLLNKMNTDQILKLQAYLDNEVSSGEARRIANWLSRDAEALQLFQELKEIKAAMAENELTVSVPESRDFYWSKIQRGIESAPVARPTVAPWWFRIGLPFAAALATLAVLMSVTTFDLPSLRLRSAVYEIDGSGSDDGSITFHSQSEGMTVVWIPSGQY